MSIHATFDLDSDPLMDTWFVSTFWPLQRMLLWIWVWKYLLKSLFMIIFALKFSYRSSIQQLSQTETPIANQWMELGDSYGRIGGRSAAPKGLGTPQEDQPSRLTSTLGALSVWTTNQRSNMSWTQAPCTHVADAELGLHVGPRTSEERGLKKNLLAACLWIMFP